MIPNGKMVIVRLQGICGTAENGARIKSMVLTGEEVCVVANFHWQVHFHFLLGSVNQTFLLKVRAVSEDVRGLGEYGLQVFTEPPMHRSPQCSEWVKIAMLREDMAQIIEPGRSQKATTRCEGCEIEDVRSDCYAWSWDLVPLGGDDAKGDVGE